MAKRGRIILGGGFFIFILLLTVFVLGYRLLTKSLPKTEGNIPLSILDNTVDVYRDAYGVPHIFARNQYDAFRVAGFVTAQDRLWQMDLSRRAASGRLSEIFGSSTVESDKFIRVWGFMRSAKEILSILSPESRGALAAYTEGINAFIQTHKDRLPVEFSILTYEPEPWKIEDSLAITRFMAWQLSFSWYVELMLSALVDKVGSRKAREVFPDFPKQAPTIISSLQDAPQGVAAFLDAGLGLREFLGMSGSALGSNSWVVSGEKSVSGKPLLANDPHLQLTTPSVWYEMHLVGGDLNVAGVALPGTPGVLIGHNQRIAWGLTNGMVDDIDFYLERINPDNANQYWTGSGWTEFAEIREDIFVKDARAFTLTIKQSQNGPVISGIHPAISDTGAVYSMRWVGYDPSDELRALLQVQAAGNWNEFRSAVEHFKVPAQNFVFASVDGDIGYQLAGSIPIRNRATGVLPHRGGSEVGQWLGYIPFEKLPQAHNPDEHFIATANNKIVDDRYPYYITNLWEPHSRSARISYLLRRKAKFTVEDFKSMQNDVTSVLAQEVMPILVGVVEARLDSSNEELMKLYHLIKDWDGHETQDSVAASIFHAFFVKLGENTLRDEMGESLYQQYVRLSNVPNRILPALLQKSNSSWFDNVLTPEKESRDDIVLQSLLDAGDLLTDMAGQHISNWAWGQVHTLTMPHPLGRKRPLDRLLNLGPFPRGGSTATINNNQYRFAQPFASGVGASTRQIVDLSNMEHALSVITTGQSGQRMSDHYKDQLPLWLAGEYHEMNMDRESIEQAAVAHLVLEASSATN